MLFSWTWRWCMALVVAAMLSSTSSRLVDDDVVISLQKDTVDSVEFRESFEEGLVLFEHPVMLPIYDKTSLEVKSTKASVVLDCQVTCSSAGVDAEELLYLSSYASFIESFGHMAGRTVRYGLIKSTFNTRVWGLFVLHGSGDVSFLVRISDGSDRIVYKDKETLSALLLLLEVAVHERAHYDNYVAHGSFGHDDLFQSVYNTLHWSAMSDVAAFRALFDTAMNGTTAYHRASSTAVDAYVILFWVFAPLLSSGIIILGVFYAIKR